MLKGLLGDLRGHPASAPTGAAPAADASHIEPADSLAATAPTAHRPPPPTDSQLEALNLPIVRKRNSPPSLDAQLRHQVLRQV